jgi:hypothetical protein
MKAMLPALLLASGLWTMVTHPAEAGGLLRKRARVVAPRSVYVPTVAPIPAQGYPMLGTFYPTPYMTVGGQGPITGGYTPFGRPAEWSLTLNGPLAATRSTAAPITRYVRGYDGRVYATPAVSTSYPFEPDIAPVVYPTRASYFYGFRQTGTPPWWDRGEGWVDLN